ncbi:hypothetical protein NEHOM01_0144 [Nematocida homosporus]|uniref:uncharacterized protein n=1 Tax=Nematocida homosporus TaxID=1912981 RepID=UPI002220EE3E|nr:uncharacterized protein NEHOM01_0144 [Nematocida homosporus]KAI5184399.1 hypothetical protein NEHOM01_0144 [Nematocida homosporus]
MLAQGRDIVVVGRTDEVCVFSLAKGMERIMLVRGRMEVSSVGLSPKESYVLIGCANGSVRLGEIQPNSEVILEDLVEVSKLGLRVTSIFMVDDVAYLGSENGVVRVVRIERGSAVGSISGLANQTGESLPESGDAWMRTMESEEETEEATKAGDSLWTDKSLQGSGRYEFSVIREIKHTTPIESICVHGQKIYILDMRGRIKIFPSRVVYDHVSLAFFKKYLLCAEENALFAEIGESLASIYFAGSGIRAMTSSALGEYLFLLTKAHVEIVRITSTGGQKMHTISVAKDIQHLVVDSERSIVYGVEWSTLSKSAMNITRLDLQYVWIDRPMVDLKIRESIIETVIAPEEEAEEEERQEYFDIPAPKSRKTSAQPRALWVSEESDRAKSKQIADSALMELFESDDEGVSDGEMAQECKVVQETLAQSREEFEAVPNTRLLSNLYSECTQNGVIGSIYAAAGQSVLLHWSPECKVVGSSDTEKWKIEVVNRLQAGKVTLLEEESSIDLASCSERILGLVTGGQLKVRLGSAGLFDSKPQKVTCSSKHEIKRLLCGTHFLVLIYDQNGTTETAFFADDLTEVYSEVGPVVAACVSGSFVGLATRHHNLFKLSLFRWQDGQIKRLWQFMPELTSLDWLGINNAGVMVVESQKTLYAVGHQRLVRLNGEPQGIPLGISGSYLVYAPRDSNGTPCLFPENVKYVNLIRESLFNHANPDIMTLLAKEVIPSIAMSLDIPSVQSSTPKENAPTTRSSTKSIALYEEFNRISNLDSPSPPNNSFSTPTKSTSTPATPTKQPSTPSTSTTPSTPIKKTKVAYTNPFARKP